jgi:hypothetical protein
MMRGRRQERREERRQNRRLLGQAAGNVRYQMRQRLVAIGDDFWIETGRGDRVFKVDGKALRVRKTLLFDQARSERHAHSRRDSRHLHDLPRLKPIRLK